MSRLPEYLLLLLDAGTALPASDFESARDALLRTARTRVIYGMARSDKLGLLVGGAPRTNNPLALDNPGGYRCVDIIEPPAPLAMDILRTIQRLEQGTGQSNLLDLLEVAGDVVSTRAPKDRVKRRCILFTNARGAMGESYQDSLEQFIELAKSCVAENITIHVILIDGLTQKEAEFREHGESESEDDDNDDGDMDDNDEASNLKQTDKEHEADEACSPAQCARIMRIFSKPRLAAAFERRKHRYNRCSKRRGHPATVESNTACSNGTENNARPLSIPTDNGIRQEALLRALAMATGGLLMSLASASASVDRPQIKPKKAVAKFRGVLDIAGIVKIPVKAFTRVAEVKRESSTRLSWNTSKRHHKPVIIASKVRMVPEGELATDVDVEPEDIADAYPYGPNYIAERNEVHGYSWSIACPKSLRVICCVPQALIQCVPGYDRATETFMGSVDVVLPMAGPPGCEPQTAMRVLVHALDAKRLGMVARFVSRAEGKPKLVYMWPKIEGDNLADATAQKSEDDSKPGDGDWACYLHMVEIPVQDDMKEFPFATLSGRLESVSDEAQTAMDAFVTSHDLDQRCGPSPADRSAVGRESGDEAGAQGEGGESDDDGEEELFDPSNYCNPALDRFYTAIVQRCLEGAGGTGLPKIPEWSRSLLDPGAHVAGTSVAVEALCDLKRYFPVTKVDYGRQSDSSRREHARGVIGEERLSLARFLPPPLTEEEERGDMEQLEEDGGAEMAHGIAVSRVDAAARKMMGSDEDEDDDSNGDVEDAPQVAADGCAGPVDVADGASFVTDVSRGGGGGGGGPAMVSEECPVSDMWALIRAKRAHEAFDTMSTMVFRKVREGSLSEASACLTAVRAACVSLGRVDELHGLLARVAAKAGAGGRASGAADDAAAFAAFVRFVAASEGSAGAATGAVDDAASAADGDAMQAPPPAFAPLAPRDARQAAAMMPSAAAMESVARELARMAGGRSSAGYGVA